MKACLGCDAILNSIVELPEWLEHRSRSLTQEVSTTEEVSSALPEKEPEALHNYGMI